ncbi:MAG: sialate O-acetylesterase, partial [Opitutales bacterium]
YIMAGQSNMQGHASTQTFPYMAKDPVSRELHDKLVTVQGAPRTFDKVIVSYLNGTRNGDAIKEGPLGPGFGATFTDKIGPEYAFGATMVEHLDEPILIIKTAWGGKSLHTDFRPPSAGHRTMTEDHVAFLAKREGKAPDEVRAANKSQEGIYYRKMMAHVKSVLEDPGRLVPSYEAGEGYELAGFIWFQGWNDLVAGKIYPKRDSPGGYEAYTESMAHFIRDVRRELDAPEMPFVVGVMGVGGTKASNPEMKASNALFREAMAAPAKLPEFAGNVFPVRTGLYWDFVQSSAVQKKWQARAQVNKMQKKGYFTVQPKDDSPQAMKAARAAESDAVKAMENKLIDEALTPVEKEALEGTSNAGYHYLGSAKILCRIGEAFALALIEQNGN